MTAADTDSTDATIAVVRPDRRRGQDWTSGSDRRPVRHAHTKGRECYRHHGRRRPARATNDGAADVRKPARAAVTEELING